MDNTELELLNCAKMNLLQVRQDLENKFLGKWRFYFQLDLIKNAIDDIDTLVIYQEQKGQFEIAHEKGTINTVFMDPISDKEN